MTAPHELLRRRVVPSTVIALSQLDLVAPRTAALARARGRRGVVELFLAFDDPCSAVAAHDLAARLDGLPVDLVALPVVRRGIPGDPAVEAKRRHAVADARRRAGRLGRVLSRTVPVDPDSTAFLAGWVAGAPAGPGVLAFTLDALEQLWFAGDGGPVRPAAFEGLWRRHVGGPPAADEAALRRTERRMRRRGPYDVPAAVAGGQWSFAHDRAAQVVARMEALGWT